MVGATYLDIWVMVMDVGMSTVKNCILLDHKFWGNCFIPLALNIITIAHYIDNVSNDSERRRFLLKLAAHDFIDHGRHDQSDPMAVN